MIQPDTYTSEFGRPCPIHGRSAMFQAINEGVHRCSRPAPHYIEASTDYTAEMRKDMDKLGIEYENQEEGNGTIR